jgi:hypothetical protein
VRRILLLGLETVAVSRRGAPGGCPDGDASSRFGLGARNSKLEVVPLWGQGS